jgi:hypothetical protein
MNRIEPQTVRLIVASALIALGTAAHAAGPSRPQESSIAPSAVPGVSVAASASAQDEKLRLELANATTRLSSVDASLTRAADRADEVARRTSRYSAYTVLGTALLTALLSLAAQGLLMRHQRNINRADSEAKVANTYVEWQLQQLSELYGPVRALLGQSNVLYRQMNRALVAADATRFQLVPGEDFDDQEFQIYLCGQWVRFRTVKHLEEVYNKEYGVEPFFDDVIDIGARLADVIREKAGFARPDDGELVHVMGQYLAHYLVLKRLHDRAKAGEKPHLNPADEQAIFPNRIQNLVDSGFKSINQQVLAWRGLETTKS